MKFDSKVFLLIFLSVFGASLLQAQIVNVEKNRKDNADGFQGSINAEFNVKESGSRIIELKNAIDLQYAKKAHTIILLNNVRLLNVDKGALINDGFQHLRYNYTLKDSSFLTFEAFGQHQYNEQKLLKRRMLLGAGPRFRLVDKENLKLYLAPLVMYENEFLSDDIGSITETYRLDSYANVYFSVNKTVDLSVIAYYQPALNNFSDFRLSGEAGMQINFTKQFAYKVSYATDFDSQPPPEIQAIFFYWKNGLIFSF